MAAHPRRGITMMGNNNPNQQVIILKEGTRREKGRGAQANNIMAARYSGGWGAPVALEASAQDAAYPGIGMDGGGNAIVSWVQWDGSRYNVWANRYVAGPGWTGAARRRPAAR